MFTGQSMPLKLSTLKKEIPQRQQDLFCGYIKQVYENQNGHIPNMITYLALVYFYVKNDLFDTANTNWTLEIDDDSIKQPYQEILDPRLMISYLKNIASNGIHIWRFKNNNTTTNDADVIGIKNIKNELELTGFFDGKGPSDGYSLFLGGLIRKQSEDNNWEELESWGNGHIINGTIIEMILDFNNLELSFKVEWKDYEASIGKAYNIEKGSYRAAIGVHGDSKKCITLLSYKHII